MYDLLPSFVQRKIRLISTKQQRLHPTSYLDGLRGVASFIVFMGHYTEENLGWFAEPYGLYEDGAPSSVLQLPFVRVMYSARPMVHIFFIISGFVLAYKPIRQIHSQQYSALASTLSSSVFRRALRLFLPSIITMFVMAMTVYFGLGDSRYAWQFEDLSSQIVDWWLSSWWLLRSSWRIGEIFPEAPLNYNPALWTIPVEFAQSMLLFLAIIGLSQCRINVRLVLLLAIMVFCFNGGQLYTVEFLGGMFIAEINILNDCRTISSPSNSPILPKYSLEDNFEGDHGNYIHEKLMQAFWICNLISGLFIASWTNDHADELWGLRLLNANTPAPYEGQAVWFCLGAFQIVIACTQLKSLQSLFNTGIAQYLGSISYALYLTHNLCLTILEPRISPYLDATFGKESMMGRQMNWAVGLLIYLPFIIWVADLFWRGVDVPTVKLARWVEGKCTVDAPKKT